MTREIFDLLDMKWISQHNSHRHQLFKKELYPLASLPRERFKEEFEKFKQQLDTEKEG